MARPRATQPDEPRRPRRAGDPGRRGIALAAGLGLVVRVAYAVALQGNHRYRQVGTGNRTGALALLHGYGFVDVNAWLQGVRAEGALHPPLATLWLAAGGTLGLRSTLAMLLWMAALGTAGIVIVGLIGRRVGGPRAGILAALIVALHPALWGTGALSDGRTVAFVAGAVAVLAAYRLLDRPTLARAGWLGAAGALAALSQPELVLLLPLLLVPVARRAAGGRRAGRASVAVGVVWAIAVLAPWVGWNLVRFDRPVALSTDTQLAVGAATCHGSWYGARLGSTAADACQGPAPATGRDGSDLAFLAQDRAVHYAGHHVAQLAIVVPARVGRTLGLWAPWQEAAIEAHAVGAPPLVPQLGAAWAAAVAALAVVGILDARRRSVALLPVVVPLAVAALAGAAVVGDTAFRAGAEAALAVLAGLGIERLLARRAGTAGGSSTAAPPVAAGAGRVDPPLAVAVPAAARAGRRTPIAGLLSARSRGATAPDGAGSAAGAADGEARPQQVPFTVRRLRDLSSTDRRWLGAMIAVALLPIVASVVHAATGGWVPVGDRATIGIRAWDVLTRHNPLVGMPATSGQEGAGSVPMNHPGPLEFWMLAPLTRLTGGSPAGLLLGAGLWNGVCVAGIVAWSYRLRGLGFALAAAVTTALLSFGLGPEILHDVLNPHFTIFPLALFLLACWSLAEGDVGALPLLVATGSLVLQSQLGFWPPTGLVALWAVGTFATRRWSGRRHGAAPGRRLLPLIGASTLGGLVLWAPPLWQQVVAKDGNLTALWHNALTPTRNLGLAFGFKNALDLVQPLPPLLHRTSSIFSLAEPASGDRLTGAALIVLVGVLLERWARRNGRPSEAHLLDLAGALLVFTTVAVARIPAQEVVNFQVRRWIWAYSWFVSLALAWVAAVWLATTRRAGRAGERWAGRAREMGVVALVAAAALGMVPVPVRSEVDGPNFALVRAIGPPVASIVASGTWVVRPEGEAATFSILPELLRQARIRGADVRVPRSLVDVRRALGPDIVESGHERASLWVVSGSPVGRPVASARLVAASDAAGHLLDALVGVQQRLDRSAPRRGALRLTLAGVAQLTARTVGASPARRAELSRLLASPRLALSDVDILRVAGRGGVFGVDPALAGQAADLWSRVTVAVFIEQGGQPPA